MFLDGYDPPRSTQALLLQAPTLLTDLRENVIWKSALYNGAFYPSHRCFLEDLLALLYLSIGFPKGGAVPAPPAAGGAKVPIPDLYQERAQHKQFCALEINKFLWSTMSMAEAYVATDCSAPEAATGGSDSGSGNHGRPIFELLQAIYRRGYIGATTGSVDCCPEGGMERELLHKGAPRSYRSPGCYMSLSLIHI